MYNVHVYMSEHIIILEILIIITKIRNQKPDLFDAVGQLAAVPNGICLYCAANIVVWHWHWPMVFCNTVLPESHDWPNNAMILSYHHQIVSIINSVNASIIIKSSITWQSTETI